MSKTTVAVYGSLRQGMGNHSVLEGAEFMHGDHISGMGMVSLGGYPACDFTNESVSGIVVEIYEVDDVGLQRLDRLEGCDGDNPEGSRNYYSRRVVQTDQGIDAWVYFIDDILYKTGLYPVEDGDWVTFKRAAA